MGNKDPSTTAPRRGRSRRGGICDENPKATRSGRGTNHFSLINKKIQAIDFTSPIETQLNTRQKENSRIVVRFRTLDYSLNMENSLKKKKKACDRPIICEANDKSNGVVISCQAGIYELLRRAALLYFSEHHKAGHSIDIELGRDKEGNHVQAVIKALYFPSGYNCYTISLYHTNSSMHINGKGTKKFFEIDWPNILKAIDEINEVCKDTNPESLNEGMKRILQEVMNILQKKGKGPNPRDETGHHNITQPAVTEENSIEQGEAGRQMHLESTRSPTPRNNPIHCDSALANPMLAGRLTTPHLLYSPRNEEAQEQSLPQSPGRREAPPEVRLQPCMETVTYGHMNRTEEPDDQWAETEDTQGDTHGDNHAEGGITHKDSLPYNEVPAMGTGHSAYIEPCRQCHTLRTNLQLAEEERQTLTKRLKCQEKALTQRERDLNIKAAQHASAKTHITALENQVKQLHETNRLLHDRLAASEHPDRDRIGDSAGREPTITTTESHLENRVRDVERQLLEMRLRGMEEKLDNLLQTTRLERNMDSGARITGDTQHCSRQQPRPANLASQYPQQVPIQQWIPAHGTPQYAAHFPQAHPFYPVNPLQGWNIYRHPAHSAHQRAHLNQERPNQEPYHEEQRQQQSAQHQQEQNNITIHRHGKDRPPKSHASTTDQKNRKETPPKKPLHHRRSVELDEAMHDSQPGISSYHEEELNTTQHNRQNE